jgi:hypothetical protein
LPRHNLSQKLRTVWQRSWASEGSVSPSRQRECRVARVAHGVRRLLEEHCHLPPRQIFDVENVEGGGSMPASAQPAGNRREPGDVTRAGGYTSPKCAIG